MSEQRRVLLANGQYITIVQTTGTSTEDVMSQNAVTTALGAKLGKSDAISFIKTVETATQLSAAPTTATTQHTITADSVSKTVDYVIGEMVRVPSTDSDTGYEFYQLHNKTAQSGAVWSVVGGGGSSNTYETVIVTVTREDGTVVTGVTVNIAGVSYVTGSDGKAIGKVLLGTSYTVECISYLAWYVRPSLRTFPAQVPQREVSMVYETVKTGVFIEATDNVLYLSNDWPSNKTANSIVVAGNGVSFRMALTQPSPKKIHSNYTDPLENYMKAISNETTAKADYNGSGNTANIMKLQSSKSYAAGYCNAFTFPDGSTKGFLPSLGQLNLAYQNKAAVDAALSKCGGTAMNTNNQYWSSTFWGVIGSNRHCWILSWSDGIVDGIGLNLTLYVRPFAAY